MTSLHIVANVGAAGANSNSSFIGRVSVEAPEGVSVDNIISIFTSKSEAKRARKARYKLRKERKGEAECAGNISKKDPKVVAPSPADDAETKYLISP